MIFGDLGGLKLPDICFTGEEKPRKNLTEETCPDRGSNPGPLSDVLLVLFILFRRKTWQVFTLREPSRTRLLTALTLADSFVKTLTNVSTDWNTYLAYTTFLNLSNIQFLADVNVKGMYFTYSLSNPGLALANSRVIRIIQNDQMNYEPACGVFPPSLLHTCFPPLTQTRSG